MLPKTLKSSLTDPVIIVNKRAPVWKQQDSVKALISSFFIFRVLKSLIIKERLQTSICQTKNIPFLWYF